MKILPTACLAAVLPFAVGNVIAESPYVAPTVEIIGTTPLPGIGLPREQMPAPVQSLGTSALSTPDGVPLPELLNRRLAGVFINDMQGNPMQPDLNYRGFTASPLLGTPQGLSLYLDGVRLNQPFGDVVSWDLIPRSAIASLDLMPGSNPVFGLNTLGGALVLQSKDGLSHPGSAVQVEAGSFGRRAIELEHGGYNDKGLHWFATGRAHHDAGWRDDSPSRVGQFFGKLGWVGGQSDLALSLALADSLLTGNGLQESRLLEADRRSVYSKPDETGNRSFMFNLTGKHSPSDERVFSGNAYFRRVLTRTLNGDVNEDSLDQNTYLTGTGDGSLPAHSANRRWLYANGYAGRFPTTAESAANTPFPYWACIAQAGQADEPAEKCNGLINRSTTRQEQYGLSGQFSRQGELAGHKNLFTAGLGYDASRVHFRQSAQFGYLNPDHSITPVNAWADGSARDDNGNPIDARVDLRGRTHTGSLFATDTLSLGSVWHLTLSGRYNVTRVSNHDQIKPGGGRGSLDGNHRFSRFNPAAGIALTPSREFNVYAGYNQGSRTPTSIELGCADPTNACKLPNAMAGDPPLRQVVTKTWEAGMRGTIAESTRWHTGLFRTDNLDDILFVANNAAGYGYFRNFGKTRRQGVELGLEHTAESRHGKVDLDLSYTFVDATFQSSETVNGAANSSNNASAPGLDGNIAIRPGDRLPLVPRHILKASASWQATGDLSLRAGMRAMSGSLARGNENGGQQADGVRYLGSGRSPGFAVFDLVATYRMAPRLTLFGQIDNVFDRHYSTAAQLGATAFNAAGQFVSRPFAAVGGAYPLVHSTFYAPGAPRTLWLALRYTFSDK